MLRKNISFFFIIIITISLQANTSRDLGPEPVLDNNVTAKWIVFYTNVQRILNGKPVLVYDRNLEKAAFWQAEYCARSSSLDHYAGVPGMNNAGDRIKHFGSGWSACGENLTVSFATNTNGVRFRINKDDKGTYEDYGNYTVFWFNERQAAYIMVDDWMHSTGHRENILSSEFILLGPGVCKGRYSHHTSYYGCQVFSYSHEKKSLKNELNIEVKQSVSENKEIYKLIYRGKMELRVFSAVKDEPPVFYELTEDNDSMTYRKEGTINGFLFAGLYDKENEILYPIAVLNK